jgi:hypothetical protein
MSRKRPSTTFVTPAAAPPPYNKVAGPFSTSLLRKRRPCGAGVSTPVWCGAWFGPNPTGGQYSQSAGTKRKTLPATATRPTDGNDR